MCYDEEPIAKPVPRHSAARSFGHKTKPVLLLQAAVAATSADGAADPFVCLRLWALVHGIATLILERCVKPADYGLRGGEALTAQWVAPTTRAPSSPRTGICEQQFAKKSWRRRRRRPHHLAASSRCTTQAARAGRTARRILGHHPPRDKEHQLASRKCRRERARRTPLNAVVETGVLSAMTR